MSYKPDEALLMAYLYGELQGEQKQKVEEYLANNAQAAAELESLQFVRKAFTHIEDKEVIAPPIVLESSNTRALWKTHYGRMILAIAASFTLLILVGKFTSMNIRFENQVLTIGFGQEKNTSLNQSAEQPSLSATDVQQMIDVSLEKNNLAWQANLAETQNQVDAVVRKNLVSYSNQQFDALVKKVSVASDEQIRQFALSLQADNARMIKDYLTLNSGDQRKYMEELLVDFAKYLEQQHRNDLQVMQARINTLEQNSNVFQYETEQILTSIISSVDNSSGLVTKN